MRNKQTQQHQQHQLDRAEKPTCIVLVKLSAGNCAAEGKQEELCSNWPRGTVAGAFQLAREKLVASLCLYKTISLLSSFQLEFQNIPYQFIIIIYLCEVHKELGSFQTLFYLVQLTSYKFVDTHLIQEIIQESLNQSRKLLRSVYLFV